MATMTTAAKGKRIEVEIITDTYKINGTLLIQLAGAGVYSSRLSDFLYNPEKPFLALTNVSVEAFPDPEVKWRRAIPCGQQECGDICEGDQGVRGVCQPGSRRHD